MSTGLESGAGPLVRTFGGTQQLVEMARMPTDAVGRRGRCIRNRDRAQTPADVLSDRARWRGTAAGARAGRGDDGGGHVEGQRGHGEPSSRSQALERDRPRAQAVEVARRCGRRRCHGGACALLWLGQAVQPAKKGQDGGLNQHARNGAVGRDERARHHLGMRACFAVRDICVDQKAVGVAGGWVGWVGVGVGRGLRRSGCRVREGCWARGES